MSSLPNRLGKSWSNTEVKELLTEVQKKVPIELIADLHERTQGGIISRLRVIAAESYFKNTPMPEIQKMTGLSVYEISDAIAKREAQTKWREEKQKKKQEKRRETKHEQVTLVKEVPEPVSDTKEIIFLLKDIKILLQTLINNQITM
jgi:hypothetical protein